MNTPYLNTLLRYFTFCIRLLMVIVIVILSVTFSYYVLKYAYPFVISFLATISINPIVEWTQKKFKCPRGVAILFVMFGLFGTVASILSLFTFEIINGLSFLIARIPDQIDMIMNYVNDYFINRLLPFWEKALHIFYSLDPAQQDTIQANLKGLTRDMTAFVSDLGAGFLTSITKFVLFLPSALTIMVIIFLATFFMCKDWHAITYLLRKRLAHNVHTPLVHVFHEFREALAGYFRAQCALMSITCAVMIIVLSVLQVNHAFTIAIITALVDFLPYIGTGAILLPWSLYSLLSGQPIFALYLISLYLLLVMIRQVMEPKMLAASIGLNPLATLIAIFVGYKLFGILGLFIGPAAIVLLKALSHADVFKTTWAYITHDPDK